MKNNTIPTNIQTIESIISQSGVTHHGGRATLRRDSNGHYTFFGNSAQFDFWTSRTEDGGRAIFVQHLAYAPVEFDSRYAQYLWFAAWEYEEEGARKVAA